MLNIGNINSEIVVYSQFDKTKAFQLKPRIPLVYSIPYHAWLGPQSPVQGLV